MGKKRLEWSVVEQVETAGQTTLFRTGSLAEAYCWMLGRYNVCTELARGVAITHLGGLAWLDAPDRPVEAASK